MPITSGAPVAPTGCRATLSGLTSLSTPMFTDCAVPGVGGCILLWNMTPTRPLPPQTCTLVVFAAVMLVIKITYHGFGSVKWCIWSSLPVIMSQGPTIRALSFYLYIPQRDGWIRQDRGPRDPPHGEPSDLRGCKINLSLTLVFNISSLLGNTNRFKGNIQFGFHILAGIKQGRNCVVRLSRAAFFYLFCLHARRGAMWEILAHRFIIISKPTVPTKRLAGEFVQI